MEATRSNGRAKLDIKRKMKVSSSISVAQSEITSWNNDYLDNNYPKKAYFSIKETAEILGVSEKFIASKIRTNKIQSTKYGDRVMIHRLVMIALLAGGVN